MPPHRLRAMLAEQAQDDQEGEDYQRLTWDALRKSINGLINKVNVANIKLIVPEVSVPHAPVSVGTERTDGQIRGIRVCSCSART